MQFTNFNIFSILIFIIILLIIIFLAYSKYFSQINFNKKYKLLSSDNKFYLKYIFLIISFLILLFSIFWVKYWEKKDKTLSKWIDIIFVLDVSKSMNVEDVNDWKYSYTRLNLIKESIFKFVTSHSQDRFWLVIFAWDAISTAPLTTDHNLFLTFLKWVDYRNLIVQGSDFSKAINLWIQRFTWNEERSKALIFISDWWDKWDNTNINIKDYQDINFSVIWVGTKNWWKIIKWRDFFWKIIYHKYKWKDVISKLNIDNLEEISGSLDTDLIEINSITDIEKVNKKLSKIEKKVLEKINNKDLSSFSRILTIISFIFFIIFLIFYIIEWKIKQVQD
jgi:Ca-activated chloride channel family protein